MTREQAFEILGLSQEELVDNFQIQRLLTQHADSSDNPMQLNSIITNQFGTASIKVRNMQALIDSKYSHQCGDHDATCMTGGCGEAVKQNKIHLNLFVNSQIPSNFMKPVFKIEKVSR